MLARKSMLRWHFSVKTINPRRKCEQRNVSTCTRVCLWNSIGYVGWWSCFVAAFARYKQHDNRGERILMWCQVMKMMQLVKSKGMTVLSRDEEMLRLRAESMFKKLHHPSFRGQIDEASGYLKSFEFLDPAISTYNGATYSIDDAQLVPIFKVRGASFSRQPHMFFVLVGARLFWRVGAEWFAKWHWGDLGGAKEEHESTGFFEHFLI